MGSASVDREHLLNRISACDLRLQRNEKDPFFKKLVTGDETWILYENITRKRSWSRDKKSLTVARSGLHPKKVLVSIWWDWKSVIYYELLPQGEINSVKYCSQLDKLKETIAIKRPELTNRRGVVFQHDNARPRWLQLSGTNCYHLICSTSSSILSGYCPV